MNLFSSSVVLRRSIFLFHQRVYKVECALNKVLWVWVQLSPQVYSGSNPYFFMYHFQRKRYPFCIPSVKKRYPSFHVPTWEHSTPLTAGPSFQNANKSLKQARKSSCNFHTRKMRLFEIQSTPDNLNLQGKLKKVRVIGSSSYRELEKKGGEERKKTVFNQPFNCRKVMW